jgi:nucleotide-binding universal stress UspA family protein
VQSVEEETMKRIIAAVELSEASDGVVAAARELAAAFDARVWLVHVAAPDPEFVGYEAGPQTVRDDVAEHLREEHRDLQRRASELRDADLDAHALLVQGSTADTILSLAERLEADAIVMGRHNRGALARVFLGSTSEGVLRGAGCPIWIAPPA